MKRFTTYGALAAFIQALLFIFATPAMAAEKLIVAFGDSLVAGYGLKPSESFPAQLQATLRKNGIAARVHNAGVSGDTSAAGKARLGWVLASLKVKPDLVILELGANDMLRGLAPAQTRANLDTMLTELKRRGIRVILAGMRASPNMGKAFQAQFDPIYPALARKHGARLHPFFMAGVAAQKPLLIADGMHPNPRGVSVIVRSIYPLVAAGVR
jgi:acyl-CoA thioesterase I